MNTLQLCFKTLKLNSAKVTYNTGCLDVLLNNNVILSTYIASLLNCLITGCRVIYCNRENKKESEIGKLN